MPAYESVLHCIALAQYWLALFKISVSSRKLRTALRSRCNSSRSSILRRASEAASANCRRQRRNKFAPISKLLAASEIL